MATGHLIGGISSAGRAVPGPELLIARGAGPLLWDVDGQAYIDTALGFGSTILGHAPVTVTDAVAKALRDGPSPAFPHPAEEAAAAALARHAGPLDRVVFVNSGSEAVHLACRIARAATGRSRIAKLAAGYDGWYDEQALGNAGSADARLDRNRRPDNGRMVLLRFNDPADTAALFADRDDIAAILFEPMLANAGCLPADPAYLAHLQATARRHGALLIADEVLMGFRLHAGLTSHRLGMAPDLATVGKAIGSGIAVAAVLGHAAAMAPLLDGRAARAGTYSGNPMACAAVLATLTELDRRDYPALLASGDALRQRIETAFAATGQPLSTSGFGSVFSLWPTDTPPRSYAEALRHADPHFSAALHQALRAHGVLLMPAPFGRAYLSFAHDAATLDALGRAFQAAAALLGAKHSRNV